MALKVPQPGQVLNYPYLWHREHASGDEEGRKIRPVVVLFSEPDAGKTRIYVLPVTKSTPRDPRDGLEIPERVKAHLQLNAERSWIMTSELNHFEWPGVDIPGNRTDWISRGAVPHRMTEQLQKTVRQRVSEHSVKPVDRDIDVIGRAAVLREPPTAGLQPSLKPTVLREVGSEARREWKRRNEVADQRHRPDLTESAQFHAPEDRKSGREPGDLGR